MKIKEIITEFNSELKAVGRANRGPNSRVTVDPHPELDDVEKNQAIDPGQVDTAYISNFMKWPKNTSFMGSNKKSSAKKSSTTTDQPEVPQDVDFYKTIKNLLTKNKEFGSAFVDIFGEESKKRGYDPDREIYKQDAILSIVTKNQINIRLSLKRTADKPSIFIGRFQTSEKTEEYQQQLNKILKSKFPEITVRCVDDNPKTKSLRIDFKQSLISSKTDIKEIINNFLNLFWSVTDSVESLGDVQDDVDLSDRRQSSGGRGSGSDIIRPQTPLRYYIGAAEMIKLGVTRSLRNIIARGTAELYDMADDMITVGATDKGWELLQAGDKKPYREHAVPCELIVRRAVDMYQEERATVADVATMIRKNLMIVLVSDVKPSKDQKSERELLDAKYRTTMPPGWNFDTGHPLARFRAVDPPIPVYSIQDNKRLSETELY